MNRCLIRSISSVVPKPYSGIDFAVTNERILDYTDGTTERKKLQSELKQLSSNVEDIPIVIGEKEYRTDQLKHQVMPHDHGSRIAQFYYATPKLINEAIEVSKCAQKIWDSVALDDKISIWHKAANLMANKYRMTLNASTMLGQSKTAIQAEIDAAAELIDFMRFNTYYLKELHKYQPVSADSSVTLNTMRYRGLEGFVAAISPFNFTAIGGNLAFTPALMGCSVLWKPSDTAILSNWTIFKIMREAGLPAGVVNFVPCDGPTFGDLVTSSPDLAGINFTGSVPTFRHLWKQVGEKVENFANFPRLVGECGGKNYHFVHPSADIISVINGTLRSAFEYSGQKCSACSRIYVPESLWPKIKLGMLELLKTLKIGDVTDFSSFASAVIDEKAFKRIKGYIERAKNSENLEIIAGGTSDDSRGFFIQPTIIRTKDPLNELMREEIFGPVLTVFVYADDKIDETLALTSNQYALTGAIFSQDHEFSERALDLLKYTAGNFYINDKSTGSVVGQQPFGGSRMSGTNDKAGGPHYILRWTTPQAIKETFVPLTEVKYKYMK